MALEDYPFGVEELTPAGEMVRIIAYLDHPIIAAQRSGPACAWTQIVLERTICATRPALNRK